MNARSTVDIIQIGIQSRKLLFRLGIRGWGSEWPRFRPFYEWGLLSWGHRSFRGTRAWGQKVEFIFGRIVSTVEFASNFLCLEKSA